jgi:hypothetical protein
MRLAAAIPAQKREGLTSDHGELLLNIDQKKRQALFRGERISIDEKQFDFKQLIALNRHETRRLIGKLRKEKRGTQA